MDFFVFFHLLLMFILITTHHAASSASPPSERSYNILMLLPVSSISHRHVHMPLATALTERGHKITMLSNHPPADDNPSITYLEHGLPHFREENLNFFEIRDNPLIFLRMLFEAEVKIAEDIYNLPSIRQLYDKRNEFDMFIIDHGANDLIYPFVHGRSFITLSTMGMEPIHSAAIGNLQNPAYVQSLTNYDQPMSLLSRIASIATGVALNIYWKHWSGLPRIQNELRKHFPDLPPLLEFERNQSLVLLNSHFSLSTPLPLVPGQIEVGCMHCRPGKPLPKDILHFVSSKEEVIYMSLGSVVRGKSMPQHYQEIIIRVFKNLPYNIIWKYENQLDDLPKNILVNNWMPQQDLLAHPNVKLFISHCGLLSTQEAMFHGKPVLGLPVFADQPQNAKLLQNARMGKMLVWEELTESLFRETIDELMNNRSYGEKISTVSAIFRDQLQTPVERAVFWTEYAIRNEGVMNLWSPAHELSLVEVLHLDILLVVHISLYMAFRAAKKLIRFWGQKSAADKMKLE